LTQTVAAKLSGLAAVAVLVLCQSAATLPGEPADALVGFSFSPESVSSASGRTPAQALEVLLERIAPALVRLPVYWDVVAPTRGQFDFAPLDELIGVVDAHNVGAAHEARVLLVVGARNITYPELHLPAWLDEAEESQLGGALYESAEYRAYLQATFDHYARLPILYAWQIENEPLDSVTTDRDGSIAVPAEVVANEVRLAQAVVPQHPVVVTTFNSSHVSLDRQADGPLAPLYARLPGPKAAGHPNDLLQLGDALGLDLYVVTPSTNLADASAARRIGWKGQTLDYWAQRARAAGNELWITEMQAAPWQNVQGFTTADLARSAIAYRSHGVSVILLWGVESWLDDDRWMQAGLDTVRLLNAAPS
jgi:hypothetical protein